MTGALWVPWADHHPVPLRESQERTMRPVGLVRHTAVSNGVLVVPTGTVRWHFYVSKSGTLTQFFPVNRPAACQLDGNFWTVNGQGRGFLSAESWDGARAVWDGRDINDIPLWTDDQLETWSRLDVWIHTEWGVPLVKATAARGTGFGEHAQFTSKTFPRWNEGHSCVTPRRRAQMTGILARSQSLAATPPASTNPPPEEDLPTPQDVWAEPINPGPTADKVAGWPADQTISAASHLTDTRARVYRLEKVEQERYDATQLKLSQLREDTDGLRESIQGLYGKLDAVLAELRGGAR